MSRIRWSDSWRTRDTLGHNACKINVIAAKSERHKIKPAQGARPFGLTGRIGKSKEIC